MEPTFTLFNRLSALKVMEAHIFFQIITRRKFVENARFYLMARENPEAREEEAEGLIVFSNISLICCQRISLVQFESYLLPTAMN